MGLCVNECIMLCLTGNGRSTTVSPPTHFVCLPSGLLLKENLIVKVLNARGLRAWQLCGKTGSWGMYTTPHPYPFISVLLFQRFLSPPFLLLAVKIS